LREIARGSKGGKKGVPLVTLDPRVKRIKTGGSIKGLKEG